MWPRGGVSAKVVRSYFQILEDTLLGFRKGLNACSPSTR